MSLYVMSVQTGYNLWAICGTWLGRSVCETIGMHMSWSAYHWGLIILDINISLLT